MDIFLANICSKHKEIQFIYDGMQSLKIGGWIYADWFTILRFFLAYLKLDLCVGRIYLFL